MAAGLRSGGTRHGAVLEHGREAMHTTARAGGALALGGDVGHEYSRGFLPLQFAARLREKMDARREASRHQHQVAGQWPPLAHVPRIVEGSDVDGGDPEIAARAQHRRPRHDLDAGAARCLHQSAINLRAQVRDRGDRDASLVQVERRAISIVGRGHDHGAGSRAHAVAMQVAPRGAGQHDSRPVVAREHQRLLDGAGREHDFARAQLPQAFARPSGRRFCEVIGEAFAEPDQVVREIAEGGRAREQPHARVARQRRDGLRQPLPGRTAVDARPRVGQQRTAELRLFVAEHHARTAIGRSDARRRGPRAPRPRPARRNARNGIRTASGSGCDGARPSPVVARISGSYSAAHPVRGHMKVL